MKIFKFGGASLQDIDRIKITGDIISEYNGQQLIIIVSAMGKTTNALEKVVAAFVNKEKESALQLFSAIKEQHLTKAKYLLVTHYNDCYHQLNTFFTEAEWLLHDNPVREYDYYYDQIVSIGELISSCIVSNYLKERGIHNKWIDVRDVFLTDDNFRDATLDWEKTTKNTSVISFADTKVYLTQGFIGSTSENENTTLGREGSDYSAAIFANILSAESLTIWKDVEGVMNADPKTFKEAEILKELSFNEVIEMAFYGAQVIHPKTIKPLENKGIPLFVKCFLNSKLEGTVISKKGAKNLPPIYVIKQKQVLINLVSKDFSFVGEEPMIELYKIFKELKIKANLIQTGAVSLQLCMDDQEEKISSLALKASQTFEVSIEKGLELLSIRHYNDEIIGTLTKEKQIVLSQKTKQTIQMLFRG